MVERIRILSRIRAPRVASFASMVLVLAGLPVPGRASGATLKLVDVMSNTRFGNDFGEPGKRIYGSLDAVTAVRFLTDPAPQGTTFVASAILADASDNRLVWRYYDPIVRIFGYRGYGQQSPGRYARPHGVAARSTGEVYVADTGHSLIHKLSFNANQVSDVWVLPIPGSATTFSAPRQISLDRDGNLYIADTFNNCIRKLDPDGNPINSFILNAFLQKPRPTNRLGSFGGTPGRFMVPMAVAVSYLSGSIYVADVGTNRIQQFDNVGKVIRIVHPLPGMESNPAITSMDTDLFGRVWAVDSRNSTLYVLSSDLKMLDVLGGSARGRFYRLRGVAVDKSFDASGQLYSNTRIYTTEEQRLSEFEYILSGKLVVMPDDGRVSLNWSYGALPAEGVLGYVVDRLEIGQPSYQRIASLDGRNATVYEDTSVSNYRSYMYRVAIVGLGGMEYSPLGPTPIFVIPAPLPPQSLVASPAPGAVLLQWVPSQPGRLPVVGHDVYRRFGASPFMPIARVNGGQATSFLDDAADRGKTYNYQVRGRDGNDRVGGPSNIASAAPGSEKAWRHLQQRVDHQSCAQDEAIGLPPVRKWGSVAGKSRGVVIAGSRVLSVNATEITAQDRATGTALWMYEGKSSFPPNVTSCPAVQGRSVYFTTGSTLACLDLSGSPTGSGLLRWSYRFVVPQLSAADSKSRLATPVGPTVAGGVVYLAVWGKAYAFDAETGTLLWSLVLPGVGTKELILPPVVDGERVFMLSESGVLTVVGAGDYDTIWQAPRVRYTVSVSGAGLVSSAPTLSAGMVLVEAPDRIAALEATTGNTIWAYALGGSGFSAGLAVFGDLLMATTTDGLFMGLEKRDGQLLWRTSLRFSSTLFEIAGLGPPSIDANGTIFMTATTLNPQTRKAGGHLIACSVAGGVTPALSYASTEDIGPTNESVAIAEDTLVAGTIAYGLREATRLAIALPSTVTSRQSVQVSLSAVDDNGVVVGDFAGTVALTSTDPLAVLPSTVSFLPADHGAKRLTIELVTTGVTILKATVVDRPWIGGSARVNVQPTTGVVQRFLFGLPVTAQAGLAFSLTVTAADRFGNPVRGYTGTIAFTSTDPAGILPAEYSFTKADGGTRSCVATLFGPGVQRITASDTSRLTRAFGSATILVTPGHEFISFAGESYGDIDFFGPQGWIVGAANGQVVFRHLESGSWIARLVPPAPFPTCSDLFATGVSMSSSCTGVAHVAANSGCPEGRGGYRLYLSGTAWTGPEAMPISYGPATGRAVTLVSRSAGWEAIKDMSAPGEPTYVYGFDGADWVSSRDLGGGTSFPYDFRFVRGQPTEGWALGGPRGLLHYLGGEWNDSELPSHIGFSSLWMNSPTDVWGGVWAGVGMPPDSQDTGLWHYGGTTWSHVAVPGLSGSTQLLAIHFLDASHGILTAVTPFVAGCQLFYYVDGNWSEVPIVPPAGTNDLVIYEMRMVAPAEAWAIGATNNGGVIIHLRLPSPAGGGGYAYPSKRNHKSLGRAVSLPELSAFAGR